MIPLHDVVEQNRSIGPELNAAMGRVLNSGILIGGNEVAEFERKFSEYIGVQHTVGVGNATDGFEIAFKALELDRDAEIIVPANAHISPALAAMNVGLKPVFCDVDEDRMLLTRESVAAAYSSKTKAVVAVHLYGRVCNMSEISNFCKEREIHLIEDFSQAHGASFGGKKVGSLGDINVCSFYPTKPLGALGDGGAITTNSSVLANKCRVLAQYGWNPRDNATVLGQNSRLDSIQAAVLLAKLGYLDQWNSERVERARSLNNALSHYTHIRTDGSEEGDICHLFPIRTTERDSIQTKLKKGGVECGIHFPIPIHKQTIFYYELSLPTAEKCCEEVLSIPLNTPVQLFGK